MQALPKSRAQRAHWQHASRLLLDEVRPALTRQVQVALFMDGKLDDGAFRHLSALDAGDGACPCAMNEGHDLGGPGRAR
jgi:hypothetical protein